MSIAVMSVMSNNPYEVIQDHVDGMNRRMKIRFDVGLTVMMKTDCSPTLGPGGSAGKEEASYRVAYQLGLSYLVPPTIMRTLKDGSKWSIQLWCVWPQWKFIGQRYGNQALEDMALFDSVTGNQDRHNGNILAKSPSEIKCIDNGMGMLDETSTGQHPIGSLYANRSLSDYHLEILKRFLKRNKEITLEINRLVTETAITKMFARVETMIKNKQLPYMR